MTAVECAVASDPTGHTVAVFPAAADWESTPAKEKRPDKRQRTQCAMHAFAHSPLLARAGPSPTPDP